MDIHGLIAVREKGKIPVSIGTSLALEGAAGILDEAPVSPAPLLSVREVWINLRTLFRNLHGCLEKEVRDAAIQSHFIPALVEEMLTTERAIESLSSRKAKVIFYYCSFTSLKRRFPKANIKEPSTDNQRVYAHLEKTSIEGLLAELDRSDNDDFTIKKFDVFLEGSNPKSFIISHLPIDLLSHRRFEDLQLVESHTGSIKGRHQWNTKLTNGKGLIKIPFNKMTIQVFGDGNNLFSPLHLKLRKDLLEVAEKYNWTVATTVEKIMYTVKMSKNKELEELARELLAS